MANKVLNIVRFSIAPFQMLRVLPFDTERQYFFIANSATSPNEMYVALYDRESNGVALALSDVFAIYQGGYWEPNVVPQNAVSIYNASGVNTITGFVYT